jgi:Xaa-Pro aminopeptidase
LFSSVIGAVAHAQGEPFYQSHFPPEEFRGRWAKIIEKIGPNAVAIVQGAPQTNGFILPRQTNEFYYLSGIETPGSYLLLDGATRKAILCLPARDARLESAEGRVLSAADAELVKKFVGVDEVWSTKQLTPEAIRGLLKGEAPAIHTPFAPAEGAGQSRDTLRMGNAAIANDPWDQRPTRESHFAELLRTRIPNVEVKDLSLILDGLRSIKSPREIALIRRASQLAGLGIIEAMKSTRPGVYEYQLDAAARYVYIVNGARLEGYRSIIAGGTANIWNMHYYRNDAALRDGDLVLMDYAPDYAYYTSDVARMWPVNGKFSPQQRELLGFVLEYRNAIMKRIRPGVTPRAIQAEAKEAMEPVFSRTKFSKLEYEKAARNLVERGGGVFSHTVGMAVHDAASYGRGALPLAAGQVFSVDPQMRVPEEKLYIRYEDVVVVTEKGVENFTDFLPAELEEIEKVVGSGSQGGIVQKVPGVSEAEVLRMRAP